MCCTEPAERSPELHGMTGLARFGSAESLRPFACSAVVRLQRSALLLWPIPVEVCPTSNCTVLQLRSLRSHPTLHYWLRSAVPQWHTGVAV